MGEYGHERRGATITIDRADGTREVYRAEAHLVAIDERASVWDTDWPEGVTMGNGDTVESVIDPEPDHEHVRRPDGSMIVDES